MSNSIKPDRKLLTKAWLILFTITFFVILAALLLQIFVPLGEEVTPGEISRVLWPVTAGIIFLFWIITIPIMILWINNLEYLIKDDRVMIYKGILTKIQKNIPYRAITDFVLHRSLYDRFLGIASIRIQTAGQSQSATGFEGNMAGLLEWDSLHKDLRGKLKKLHPVSESLATREMLKPTGEQDVQQEILSELKAIRKALEKS